MSKTKTKVITLANDTGRRLSNKPIKTRVKYTHAADSKLGKSRGRYIVTELLNFSCYGSKATNLKCDVYCFMLPNNRLTLNNDILRTGSSHTILYCSSSILARSESLSNMDTLKPSVIAKLSWTTGCNCLWSPIKTTCRAFEHVIGTRDSSSMHMPHSSTMHCWILPQDLISLGFPDATHVQRIIWTPDS